MASYLGTRRGAKRDGTGRGGMDLLEDLHNRELLLVELDTLGF